MRSQWVPSRTRVHSRLKLEKSREGYVGVTSCTGFQDPSDLRVLCTCEYLRKKHFNPFFSKLLTGFLPGEIKTNNYLTSPSFPVCISYLGRFYQDLKDRDVTFSPATLEEELIKFCREARGKENRLVSSWWPTQAVPGSCVLSTSWWDVYVN